MSNCRRCEKPVFFAERKQSIGFDWHPWCLRCYGCEKRLHPGSHAEHKGFPYCDVPCYGQLFGPSLFGHGSLGQSVAAKGSSEVEERVIVDSGIDTCTDNLESNYSSGGTDCPINCSVPSRQVLERKLKLYNQYYESMQYLIKSRERSGRLILHGVLKLYWSVTKLLHFKENDDQRPIRVSRVEPLSQEAQMSDSDTDSGDVNATSSTPQPALPSRDQTESSSTEPEKADSNDSEKHRSDDDKNGSSDDSSLTNESNTESPVRRPARSRIVRRGKRFDRKKLKRRCSINGHFYNRETSVFTPPRGSVLSVWVTSLITSYDIIKLVLHKYRVEDDARGFALYIVWDTGEQRRLRDDEFPLITRVMIGPSETAARIFIMDVSNTVEIKNDVAQYINLSDVECTAILQKYREEEEFQVIKIKEKYAETKDRIRQRMCELKVRL